MLLRHRVLWLRSLRRLLRSLRCLQRRLHASVAETRSLRRLQRSLHASVAEPRSLCRLQPSMHASVAESKFALVLYASSLQRAQATQPLQRDNKGKKKQLSGNSDDCAAYCGSSP